ALHGRRGPGPGSAAGSSDAEDAARDVPLAAGDLHRVVLRIEVVDAAHPPRRHLPGIRVAQVPAAAVVAHDQLASPGAAAVLADRGADAVVRQPVAIHGHDAPVAHAHQAGRRAEIVDAREEAPGTAAVIAGVHLRPHDALRIALAAQRAQDAPAGQQDGARVE